jgi:hypothetical protein
MNISELMRGDKFYRVLGMSIESFTYLCVHPNNNAYHILIDKNQEPLRMYNVQLQQVLNQGLQTYEQAKIRLAEILEEQAKFWREK